MSPIIAAAVYLNVNIDYMDAVVGVAVSFTLKPHTFLASCIDTRAEVVEPIYTRCKLINPTQCFLDTHRNTYILSEAKNNYHRYTTTIKLCPLACRNNGKIKSSRMQKKLTVG